MNWRIPNINPHLADNHNDIYALINVKNARNLLSFCEYSRPNYCRRAYMAHDTEPTIFVEGEETGDFLRDSDIIPSMTFAIDMFSYNERKMKFGAEELVEKIA